MSTHVNGPVWDDRPTHPYPPLQGSVSADVCVVGLGGSGLAAVDELLDRGVSVVGIDAGKVGGGAAGRNGGFFLAGTPDFHHRSAAVMGADRAAALYRLTIAELERMRLQTPEAVRRTGSVRLGVDQAEIEDCRLQMASMAAAGLPVEPYAGPEGYGLRFPLDCAGQPLRRCRRLAAWTHMRGAKLSEQTRAVTLKPGLVQTSAGEVRCGATIVAVDGRLDAVLPELRQKVRTVRLQMLATAPAIEVDIPQPMYARYGYDYWQQTPDKRVVLGGLRDLGGPDEDTDVAMPTPAVQAGLEELLRVGLGVRAPITHRWAGVVGYTDDKLPVVGEVRDRIWAAGGYSGTGNVIGAICGRAMAEAALGLPTRLDGILVDAPRSPAAA